MQHPVRVSGDFVGYIDGACYTKEVSGSKHLLRKPAPAWCFDAESMDKYIVPFGVDTIVVKDRESHIRYCVSMANFLKYRGELDRGHGKQYFLILKYWGRE